MRCASMEPGTWAKAPRTTDHENNGRRRRSMLQDGTVSRPPFSIPVSTLVLIVVTALVMMNQLLMSRLVTGV